MIGTNKVSPANHLPKNLQTTSGVILRFDPISSGHDSVNERGV
jgi:hypothetical protein